MPKNCKEIKRKRKREIEWCRIDYCDFCHCTFPDNKTNRNKHNQGRTHVQNRKLHYDWFSGKQMDCVCVAVINKE